MTLLTLAEFNEQRLHEWKLDHSWLKPNGIACPRCSAELYDEGDYILTSNPPMRKISCKECGFTGTRYA